jgi:hypothetical protein
MDLMGPRGLVWGPIPCEGGAGVGPVLYRASIETSQRLGEVKAMASDTPLENPRPFEVHAKNTN